MANLNIRPKIEGITLGQQKYLDAVRTSDITLCDGPAGTGKTFMAIGFTARDVLEKLSRREKIIVARPGVSAGEEWGFLPGKIQNKTEPYMVPVFDAFREFCKSGEEYDKCIKDKTFEVVPLAYMRGRSIDRAWMILDEAQNATKSQIEMFITRMGKNTRVILSGSRSQCDLPGGPQGWDYVCERFAAHSFRRGNVSVCKLTRADIVRHDLIGEVLEVINPHDEPEEPEPPVTWLDVYGQ